MNEEPVKLSELRQKQSLSPKDWIHRYCPWLFRYDSLFYYGLFIFAVGLLWCAYSIFTNSFTQLYGWDYEHQYVTFTYNYWDCWHRFFTTGYFPLYNTGTLIGTDNIGSNSYYGLFDPFLFVCYILPRSWIPQTFLLATYAKCIVAAFAMRAYLRYMNVKEGTSRLGGLIFAYSGFVNFFVGFPSFVSIVFTVPLVMLGVEKVIRERKISCLVFGVALLGMVSFFFLVVVCIWGVLYALWRYFWTIKSRSLKDNLLVIALGVASFAVGLMLCAWTLLPSVRESSLSGRTISIGRAYLNALLSSVKSFDFRFTLSAFIPNGFSAGRFFAGQVSSYPTLISALQGAGIGKTWALLFETVGRNPGRELMGLISFFYPTCNYLWLPLANSSAGAWYDAWTSSLFCYTPMVIFFFVALLSSLRRKQWSHLIAILLCAYLLFTTFAYYFFFGFAGDGYGRWFIVLVPLIIYYGCQEIDRLQEEPRWLLPLGSLCAVALTGLTWLITYQTLNGASYTYWGTYYPTAYNVPASVSGHSLLWLILYQLGLVLVESLVILYLQKKPSLWKIISGFATLEIIVCGNISFAYGSSFSYAKDYMGGTNMRNATTEAFSQLANYDDDSYYRSTVDYVPLVNGGMGFGYNGAGAFHSLFNYDVDELLRYSHTTGDVSSHGVYGTTVYSQSWSAFYGNKRFAMDQALSTKYMVVRNHTYPSAIEKMTQDNVPFGAECVIDTGTYRIYKNPYVERVSLGHAVDSLYDEGETTNSVNNLFFAPYMNDQEELMRNEEIYLDGAIIEHEDVAELSDQFSFSTAPSAPVMTPKVSYGMSYYETVNRSSTGIIKDANNNVTAVNDYTYYFSHWDAASDTTTYEGPGYMFDHLKDPAVVVQDKKTYSGSSAIAANDYGKIVLTPSNPVDGAYFNSDPTGAYFLMSIPNVAVGTYVIPRVYMIGDTYLEDGVTVDKTNQVLCYEWANFDAWKAQKVDNSGYVFGMYAHGKVKYIVACYMGAEWGTQTLFGTPSIRMCNRSVIDAEMDKLSSADYNLQNVSYRPDQFTFDTTFKKEKLVVTSLGYDAGWSVKATNSKTGKISYPKTYKLDGGFVGFVAPANDDGSVVHYVLSYTTPYLKGGVVLAISGFALYVLYQGITFYKEIRKLQAEMVVSPAELPQGKKKKDENEKKKPNGP